MTNSPHVAVTGVNGFVGRHLVRELSSAGIRVTGLGQAPRAAQEIAGDLNAYFPGNLTQSWPGPLDVDAVIHLAGRADVGASFASPQGYIDGNSAMMTSIGEAFLAAGSRARIVVASTGAVYAPRGELPLGESAPVLPSSPYVVSKLLVEHQCDYYRLRGLDIVVARPFNHIGPGQGGGFLVPDLLEKVRTARTGGTIAVGDLRTARDYTDVRDVVRAYRLLAETPDLPESLYNISSGRAVTGERMLADICSALGRNDVVARVDSSMARPNDARTVTGDSTSLREDTGWMPEWTLDETLASIAAPVAA